MDERIRRIAEHEIRFRAINERLATDVRAVADDDAPIEFVCECGVLECTQTVSLTLAQYDAVRDDGTQFVVLAGHEIGDAEDVVDRGDGFLVVRKRAEGAPLAAEADPRRPG